MNQYSLAHVGTDYPQDQPCDKCRQPLGDLAVRNAGMGIYTGNKDGSGNRREIICILCAVAKLNGLQALSNAP